VHGWYKIGEKQTLCVGCGLPHQSMKTFTPDFKRFDAVNRILQLKDNAKIMHF